MHALPPPAFSHLVSPPPPLYRAWRVSERSSPSTSAARWVRHAHGNLCLIGMAVPTGWSQPHMHLCVHSRVPAGHLASLTDQKGSGFQSVQAVCIIAMAVSEPHHSGGIRVVLNVSGPEDHH